MAATMTRRLNPLTSIRFLAAVSVIWLHVQVLFYRAEMRDWLPKVNTVSLFFVLSGFILSYVYSSGFRAGKLRFLVARIVRLWPSLVASILLMWLVAPATVGREFTFGKLASVLTMTHAWVPFRKYWFAFVPTAWTVSTEFGLYFCFLFLISRWERTWLWKLAGSFVVLCLVILLFEAERERLAAWSGSFWYFYLYVHPLARMFEFTLGMATFELWRRVGPRIKNGLPAGTTCEFAAVAFFVLLVWLAPVFADRVTRLWFFGSDLAGLWLSVSSPSVGYAAVIFALALEQGLMARLLSHPFAVMLGELSYAIYLVHWPVLVFFSTHRTNFAGIPNWMIFSVIGAVILAIAYLVWATIERPCRMLLIKIWPTRANAAVVELPASMIGPNGKILASRHDRIILPSRWGILIASAILIVALVLSALFFR